MNDNHPFKTLVCRDCGTTHTFQLECGDRTCPSCQNTRRHRIIRRYKGIVSIMDNPVFITLTYVRKSLTQHLVRKIRRDFTKLRHRKKWTSTGGIYQIEIGNAKDLRRVNLHLHIIADFPERPVDLLSFGSLSADKKRKHWLSRTWYDITGDSFIVDVRRCFSARDVLANYLTKHMAKRIGRREDADMINSALKGTRLIQGFGTLSAVCMRYRDIECPNCGAINSFVADFDTIGPQDPGEI